MFTILAQDEGVAVLALNGIPVMTITQDQRWRGEDSTEFVAGAIDLTGPVPEGRHPMWAESKRNVRVAATGAERLPESEFTAYDIIQRTKRVMPTHTARMDEVEPKSSVRKPSGEWARIRAVRHHTNNMGEYQRGIVTFEFYSDVPDTWSAPASTVVTVYGDKD